VGQVSTWEGRVVDLGGWRWTYPDVGEGTSRPEV
jgi:hypothetical protein